MSKVKFTDSNGQDQVEEMVVLGGGTTADGSTAGLVVVADTYPAPSSFTGLQTIGATAIPFAFANGAEGLQIKVTHATQTIQVGQGDTAAEASANALVSVPYDVLDLVKEIGRSGTVSFYALLGSGASTTVHVSQI